PWLQPASSVMRHPSGTANAASPAPCSRLPIGPHSAFRTPHCALPLPLVWHAPLFDPSGYADEARNFVLGLIEAGEEIALLPAAWGGGEAGLPVDARARLEERVVPQETPAEIYVCQTLPMLQEPSPRARLNIARTMFETDRLPAPAVERLNAMDRVWV